MVKDGLNFMNNIEARFHGFDDYEDMKSWDRYLCVEEIYEN